MKWRKRQFKYADVHKWQCRHATVGPQNVHFSNQKCRCSVVQNYKTSKWMSVMLCARTSHSMEKCTHQKANRPSHPFTIGHKQLLTSSKANTKKSFIDANGQHIKQNRTISCNDSDPVTLYTANLGPMGVESIRNAILWAIEILYQKSKMYPIEYNRGRQQYDAPWGEW